MLFVDFFARSPSAPVQQCRRCIQCTSILFFDYGAFIWFCFENNTVKMCFVQFSSVFLLIFFDSICYCSQFLTLIFSILRNVFVWLNAEINIVSMHVVCIFLALKFRLKWQCKTQDVTNHLTHFLIENFKRSKWSKFVRRICAKMNIYSIMKLFNKLQYCFTRQWKSECIIMFFFQFENFK